MNFKLILYPFSLLYGGIMFLRNKLFDWNVLSSHEFNIPIISIGNLSVGGTGKSPHIEYLVRILKDNYLTAILSRGYKRDSFGFVMATDKSDVNEIGDEPLQFKKKFDDIIVAVDENRCNGINQLISINKKSNQKLIVLLDDAFQHRSVKPGLSVLLTDYNSLFYKDHVIPAGTLREFRCGYKRADIIIITKTPQNLSPEQKNKIIDRINPSANQKVLFSFIRYNTLISVTNHAGNDNLKISQLSDFNIVLFAGIANPSILEAELKGICKNVISDFYSDHHDYTIEDIHKIKNTFLSVSESNKIIVTTEKDAMRICNPRLLNHLADLPVYYIPIEIDFNIDDKKVFDSLISSYISKYNN